MDPAPWPAADRLKVALRPRGLALGIAFEEDGSADLSPAEAGLGIGLPPRRLDDLRRGRAAARRVLRMLGSRETTVLREGNGAPAFPKGFVGSISHAAGRALAVAAKAEKVGGLGVDVERIEAGLEADLADLIPLAERQAFALCFGLSGDASAIARFSLSESLYKAVSAHLDRWIDFDEFHFHPGKDQHIAIGARSADLSAVLDGAGCLLETDACYVISVFWLPALRWESLATMKTGTRASSLSHPRPGDP